MVSVEQLEDTEAVRDSELLPVNLVKRNAEFPLYVTASVNYGDFHQSFTIGDGSSSTDPILQTTFYNIPLQKDFTYYYFIRAYSAAHTRKVRLNFSVWLYIPLCTCMSICLFDGFLYYMYMHN